MSMLIVLFFIALVQGKLVLLGNREKAPEGWTQLQQAQSSLSEISLPFIVALKQQNLDLLESIYWERTNPGITRQRLNLHPRFQVLS